MKEHTFYALQSRYTSSAKYDAKHMFSYLDFRCYFEANGQNHIHFWLIQVLKNSMTWYFLTFRPLSSKLEFVYSVSPVIRRENAHLLVNPIPKLTIVLIWKTPPCLNFGKTSSRAVTNLPQRKLWVWAANDARVLLRISSHRTSGSVCFFGNDRSSHSRIRINFDPMCVLRVSEWLICIS